MGLLSNNVENLKKILSIDKFSYISQGQDKIFNDKFGILVEKL